VIEHSELVGRGWSFPLRTDGAGGIAMSAGGLEIDESIILILSTALGERVMRPNFGCRIHELVFHPVIGETIGLAQRYVEEALGWWEPRIDVRSVVVEPDPIEPNLGRLLIHITYQVRATKDERALVYPFYLIRDE
jgi:phage baseplate assembly protein W